MSATSGGLKSVFQSKGIRVISILFVVGVIAAVCVRLIQGDASAEDWSRTRIFVDAETGKSFRKQIEIGESFPVVSPFSGKPTGYLAELCYWTADGKTKSEPTAVLLNEDRKVPGPTFCPDCGRLVVGHNPAPRPGKNPPPKQGEYVARDRKSQ